MQIGAVDSSSNHVFRYFINISYANLSSNYHRIVKIDNKILFTTLGELQSTGVIIGIDSTSKAITDIL